MTRSVYRKERPVKPASTPPSQADMDINDCLCDDGCEYHCTENYTIPKKCKQPTLVQKPFKYPCDGALYFLNSTKQQVNVRCSNTEYSDILTTVHKNGIMLWNENGKNRDGCDDFLIMFVWE